MYTREAFEQLRQARLRVQTRDLRILALASVGLGLAQLGFILWADRALPGSSALPLEGGLFLAYMALVVGLLWRQQRVAAATGRCDTCGGQVIA